LFGCIELFGIISQHLDAFGCILHPEAFWDSSVALHGIWKSLVVFGSVRQIMTVFGSISQDLQAYTSQTSYV